MTRWLLALLLILGANRAEAAVRLVIQVDTPVSVFVDNSPAGSPMGGRLVLNQIEAGVHPIVFRTPAGQLAHEAWLLLPSDGEVTARYDDAKGLVLTDNMNASTRKYGAQFSVPTTRRCTTPGSPTPDHIQACR